MHNSCFQSIFVFQLYILKFRLKSLLKSPIISSSPLRSSVFVKNAKRHGIYWYGERGCVCYGLAQRNEQRSPSIECKVAVIQICGHSLNRICSLKLWFSPKMQFSKSMVYLIVIVLFQYRDTFFRPAYEEFFSFF